MLKFTGLCRNQITKLYVSDVKFVMHAYVCNVRNSCMHGRLAGLLDGWMDGWRYVCVYMCVCVCLSVCVRMYVCMHALIHAETKRHVHAH